MSNKRTLWFYIYSICSCFYLGIGLTYYYLTPSTTIITKEILLSAPVKETLLPVTEPPLKATTTEIEHFYYHAIIPQKQAHLDHLEVYDVYLGENTGMKEALGWLRYAFPQKQFTHHFSYALYNATDTDNDIDFAFRIKEPPPNLLLAYFDGGIRAGKNDHYTFADLPSLGNGATHLYYFWNKPKPYLGTSPPFIPENYHLDIVYEKGTNFGGPSYLAIDKIVVKDRQKEQIVAVYPLNLKIEEPFTIFNYDFELKFPFYNYEQTGTFWSTNRIKSLKKIDLYEKKTGQKRTLYYDVD